MGWGGTGRGGSRCENDAGKGDGTRREERRGETWGKSVEMAAQHTSTASLEFNRKRVQSGSVDNIGRSPLHQFSMSRDFLLRFAVLPKVASSGHVVVFRLRRFSARCSRPFSFPARFAYSSFFHLAPLFLSRVLFFCLSLSRSFGASPLV